MNKPVALIAVLATGAITAAPAAAAPSRVVIDDCAAHAHAQPASLALFCGDANQFITHTHWSHWGQASATATARLVTNICTPDCAAGHYRSKPATVSVGRLRDGRYTRMTVNGRRFDLTRRGPVVA